MKISAFKRFQDSARDQLRERSALVAAADNFTKWPKTPAGFTPNEYIC